MITYTLIGLVGLSSFLYKGRAKFEILYFTAICIFMSLIGFLLSAEHFWLYYILCALLNCMITWKLKSQKRITSVNIVLQIICVGFIYMNLFGCYYYYNYDKPIHYDVACEQVYCLSLFAIIWIRSVDVLGDITNRCLGSIFGRSSRCSASQFRIDEAEA